MENLQIKNILDLNETISFKLFERFVYPWEVLPHISDFIIDLGNSLDDTEFDKIGENIWISRSAKFSSSSSISGPCIIDSNAEIRVGAFIRGSVIVGKNCVIGNSTELKNCILFNNVQTPHFNYVGDSILGFRSHIGAGVILSNVKSDKTNVSIKLGGKKIETNLRKFGAILGDYVEVGCNSVLNPGSVVSRESTVYPLSMFRGFLGSRKIFKSKNDIVDKFTRR